MCPEGTGVSAFPEGASVRVVTLAGQGCPCAGTHVRSTAELAGVRVQRVRCKKGKTKVSYTCA